MAAKKIIQEQGWDDSTVLALVLTFITARKMDDDLYDYLEEIADEENAEFEEEE